MLKNGNQLHYNKNLKQRKRRSRRRIKLQAFNWARQDWSIFYYMDWSKLKLMRAR
jgi:hypothetical protein